MKDLLLSAPKMIKGQAGNYWRTAASADGKAEIYLKFKFDTMPVLVGENMTGVTGLQANVLYFGPQFDIPAPYKYKEARPYPVDGNSVEGYIIGSMHVPMGEFSQNLKLMHEYVRDVVAGPLQDALDPLYSAAEVSVSLPLTQLWALMMEGLETTYLQVAPVVYIGTAYKEYATNVVSKSKASAQAKAKATATPSDGAPDSDEGNV